MRIEEADAETFEELLEFTTDHGWQGELIVDQAALKWSKAVRSAMLERVRYCHLLRLGKALSYEKKFQLRGAYRRAVEMEEKAKAAK